MNKEEKNGLNKGERKTLEYSKVLLSHLMNVLFMVGEDRKVGDDGDYW